MIAVNNPTYNIPNTKYSLVVGWLYPELMSTYGDKGNIIVLRKRCEWRGISLEVKYLDVGYDLSLLTNCDMLFMGGAQDLQQKIVADDLRIKSKMLSDLINSGTPGLYICGAYQFLGKYYKEADGSEIEGLGILDLYTENPGEKHKRLIGNIVINPYIPNTTYNIRTLVGFENHGGRTYLGPTLKPLGTVVSGFGNNGNQPRLDGGQAGDRTEGAVYKNSFGSYLHGPILPKNPDFADLLIKLALEKKYKTNVQLQNLDDALEYKTHEEIIRKLAA